MAKVKEFKIIKKVNSKKILEDIKRILNKLDIKNITQEDTIIKPLYSVGIDIHKRISEKTN